MKKFLALVLCLTLVLTCFTAILGCSESESGDTQGGNSVSGNTDSGSSGNLSDKRWEAGLYSLNDVYEGGGITYDDLLNIAYHSGNNRHNVGLYGEDFKPVDNEAELNEQVKTEILQVLLDEYITENPEEAPYARLTDFHIERSFGCYNGFYAFTFENALINLPAVIEEYWEDVGGVKFCYGDSYYRIMLYKTN